MGDIEIPKAQIREMIKEVVQELNSPKPEDLATHLGTCPNCDKVITDKITKQLKERDLIEDETDEEEEL